MKYINLKDPIVYITDTANEKLKQYILNSDIEISGLGTVIKHNNSYVIDDIFTFNQTCNQSYTELSQDAVIEFITRKIDNNEIEFVNRIKLWWHSHVSMSTFWSPLDSSTIDRMNAKDAWISIVGNKLGDALVRVDYYNPRICLDGVNLNIIKTNSDLSDIKNNCMLEVEEKIVKIK